LIDAAKNPAFSRKKRRFSEKNSEATGYGECGSSDSTWLKSGFSVTSTSPIFGHKLSIEARAVLEIIHETREGRRARLIQKVVVASTP